MFCRPSSEASCPVTGTFPAFPCALSAAMMPPAMPSFADSTASIPLWDFVRSCSISRWAVGGSQPGVHVPVFGPTTLRAPDLKSGFRMLR